MTKTFFSIKQNSELKIFLRGVHGDQLCVSGSCIYNLYKNSKEIAYYLCSDKINDMIVLPELDERNPKFVPVLACQDRSLRILDVGLKVFTHFLMLICWFDQFCTVLKGKHAGL